MSSLIYRLRKAEEDRDRARAQLAGVLVDAAALADKWEQEANDVERVIDTVANVKRQCVKELRDKLNIVDDFKDDEIPF